MFASASLQALIGRHADESAKIAARLAGVETDSTAVKVLQVNGDPNSKPVYLPYQGEAGAAMK